MYSFYFLFSPCIVKFVGFLFFFKALHLPESVNLNFSRLLQVKDEMTSAKVELI